MLRRTLLLLNATALAAMPGGGGAGEARAQANIRPDPTPRLPPQPGQGPALEDARFLRGAAALSAAEVEAAAAAQAAGGADEEVRRLAAGLAERHRRLREEIAALAQARGVDLAPSAEAAGPGGRVAEARRRLDGLRGAGAADARAFLAAQIEVHPVLVEMYQVQASNTPDQELGSFAIRALVGLQEDFAAVVRLGEARGLRRPDHLLSNPPQYGPGAGPPR